MATLEERTGHINIIIKNCTKILNYDIETDLIKKQKLGEDLHFEELKPQFEKIMDRILQVSNSDLTQIPFSILQKLSNTTNETVRILENIKRFQATTDNPLNQRGYHINQVNNLIDNIIESTFLVVIYNSLSKSTTDVEKNELFQIINETKIASDSALKYFKESTNELQVTLESVKRAAAEVGVAQHSAIFNKEAQEHKDEAEKWMKWTVGMLITTAIGGLIFVFLTPDSKSTTGHIVQFTVTKIVVLAVLFYALAICIKNYRAHKHNAILNKHRQNALQTFETFIKAATDEQTKNAVLLQTTQSIFANQHTGYSSEGNDSDMSSKVIEIIKTAGPSSNS